MPPEESTIFKNYNNNYNKYDTIVLIRGDEKMSIIDIIKNHIIVNNNDLSFLNVGDIVWAKRYDTEEEKNKIDKGHQESPFIIIKQTKDKTYALQCTSNPHANIKWKNLFYPLNRLTYDFEKNSYINMSFIHELTNVKYIKKIGELTGYDLNKVMKYLYIVINSSFKNKPDIALKDLKFIYEIGDIISIDGCKYYIYDIDLPYFIAYKLNKKNRLKNRVLINNEFFSIAFYKNFKIKNSKKIKLIETFNTSEIELIDNYIKEKQGQKHNPINKEATIGTLIKYKDNFYYITDENDTHFICYRVYPSDEKEGNMALLKIKHGYYYTFFNTVSISKIGDYKTRRMATEEEIKYNKEAINISKWKRRKEAYKNFLQTEKYSVISIKDFIPKMVIHNTNTNKNYLILSREENIVELVNTNDLRDTFFFLLEENNCPYEYYKIMSEEEFNKYQKKINELKALANLIS